MPDLLIELFSEEIPARMQAKAAEDLKKNMTDGLVEAGLTYAGAAAFSTPRRLSLTIHGLLDGSRPAREERKGPRVDAPENALHGFLRSTGLTKEQLEARDDKKGKVWFAVIEKPGRSASDIVSETLEAVVRDFPWPKSMRWGSGSLRWVRPLHRILCVLSDETGAVVVPMDIDGIISGDVTEGHRFLAPEPFSVTGFEDYAAKLKRAHVMLDPQERAEHIWADATNIAFARGLEVVEDGALLTEVAGLVEHPVVLMGAIGADFLDLPAEVLQTSMREHQKFFSVRNPKNGRIEQFVTVANTDTQDDGATILSGYGRVLSARLADAKFFWNNDLRIAKSGMEPWLDALSQVTFHNKLGSQKERIERIATLAEQIAPALGADPALAMQAAQFAKADLSSEMVYEFPELQGVMGTYYAREAGLADAVAQAASEHYSPLGPSDDVPTAPVSVAVALADKIDTLTGFWAIEEKPTGSKDPFALRRAALGVIRLVLENNAPLRLLDWFDRANDGAGAEDLLSFFHDRLKIFLRNQGLRHDVIDACTAMPGNDDLALLVKRAIALSEVLKTDDGENLIQGFKRANNILLQAEEKDGVSYELDPDPKFSESEAETALFEALDQAEAAISPAIEAEDFAAAMAAMAELRGPIDAFFEAVQVNSDNQIVRRNRLCLLHRMRSICGRVADLTRLDG
ncbi:MAG: glycine--tRNA ligase subunit beta [Pseudomonadota bacterium]